jgi:hypothetical protein
MTTATPPNNTLQPRLRQSEAEAEPRLSVSVPPPLYPAMHKLHRSPKPPQTECEQAD